MKTRGKVFISYRRDGGAELARNIRDALQKRRFDVFMDVEDLRGGSFNKALYREIEAATDVVVVLTPGSLDRCFDCQDDWFRLELAHALKQKKNVVPILHRGFQWPDRPLPDDLAVLTEQNGMPSSHEFFEASMDRLAERLLVGWAPRPVERTRVLILAASMFLVAAALGLIWWQSRSGPNAQAPSTPTVTAAAPLREEETAQPTNTPVSASRNAPTSQLAVQMPSSQPPAPAAVTRPVEQPPRSSAGEGPSTSGPPSPSSIPPTANAPRQAAKESPALSVPAERRPAPSSSVAVIVSTKQGTDYHFLDTCVCAFPWAVLIADWRDIQSGSNLHFGLFPIRITLGDGARKLLSPREVESIDLVDVRKGVFRIDVRTLDGKLWKLSIQGGFLNVDDDDGVLGNDESIGEMKIPFSKIARLTFLKANTISYDQTEQGGTTANVIDVPAKK